MSAIDNERPPYVTFEYRPIEDRTASIAAGHYVGKDVAFALVTRPGSRDTSEFIAESWLATLKKNCEDGRVPPSWYEHFSGKFSSWQKGEQMPENGTPIKGWTVLSPSAQKQVISAGILTIEDLAGLSDSEVGTLGTGAGAYKLKAKNWLDSANSVGKFTERLSSLETANNELVETVKKLLEENKTLKAQLASKK